MKVHGREMRAVSKVAEIPCSKVCNGGSHADTVWLPPGREEEAVIAEFYLSHGRIVAPFTARRQPKLDNNKPPQLISRIPGGPIIDAQSDNVEAWEVMWKWADEEPLRKAHLN